MIQLQDNFFWKCYLASYKKGQEQKPTNICQYFWRGIFGLGCKITNSVFNADSYSLFVCLFVSLLVNFIIFINKPEISFYLIISCLQTLLISFILLIQGLYWFWNKVVMPNTRIEVRIGIFALLGYLAVCYPMLFVQHSFIEESNQASLWIIIILPWMVLGLLLLIIGIGIGIDKVNKLGFTHAAGMYLSAVKRKICPLIKSPDIRSNDDTVER